MQPVYTMQNVDAESFVAFWSARYADPRQHLYDRHIRGPLTPESLRDLYVWKNGSKLSSAKAASVEQNYVARLDELGAFDPGKATARELLDHFDKGGAIWRIFFIHCWQPDRFPIFDIHVWRAMQFIETGELDDLNARTDSRKIELYHSEYLPWCKRFSGIDPIRTDQALWTFGRFLVQWHPPLSP